MDKNIESEIPDNVKKIHIVNGPELTDTAIQSIFEKNSRFEMSDKDMSSKVTKKPKYLRYTYCREFNST